jgi:hypothetical protein
MLDLVTARNKCKKKFAKVKQEMRDVRKGLGGMHIKEIADRINTSFEFLREDLEYLEASLDNESKESNLR